MSVSVRNVKKRATFHSLKVHEVTPLTESSIEVTFAIPDELTDEFRFQAGQYVALRANLDGEELRRSYSICRTPQPNQISIAIKRDFGGRFSNWANDVLHAGDSIDVMTPQGTFTSQIYDYTGTHVVGVAAGSGITPIITMAHTVLGHSSNSRFDLIYTNRSSLDVMFVEELAELKDRYPHRLAIHHVLSREQRSAPVMSGRLDAEKLRSLFTSVVPADTVNEWVLCGPFELVQLANDVLSELGVEKTSVKFELFTTGEYPVRPQTPSNLQGAPGEETFTIDFTLDATSATVDSPASANETILAAALRVRADVPFACAGGVCGTCRAHVVQGSVSMHENYALEQEEIERGYVLTCQSRPSTSTVVVNYDS